MAVDIGGTFTDIVLDRGSRTAHPQGADHGAAARGGRAGRRAAGARRRGPAFLRHRRVHPRHDARHQRDHRAARRAHRADRHRRLSRHARYREREPLRPVRSHHREAEAAGAALAALHGAGARRCARQGAARARRGGGRSAGRAAAGQRHRGGRDLLHAFVREPGARAAHGGDPEEGDAGLEHHALVRGVPGDPRIRAHLDGGRERLRAAADGRLSGAHGRGAARRAVPRRDLSGDLGRRAHLDRYRAAAFRCGWSSRARRAARSSPRRSRRARARRRCCRSTWAAPRRRSA